MNISEVLKYCELFDDGYQRYWTIRDNYLGFCDNYPITYIQTYANSNRLHVETCQQPRPEGRGL